MWSYIRLRWVHFFRAASKGAVLARIFFAHRRGCELVFGGEDLPLYVLGC